MGQCGVTVIGASSFVEQLVNKSAVRFMLKGLGRAATVSQEVKPV